jgi:SnoaL-like domain
MRPEEAPDRVAIRELIDAYAHCADRCDADGQMALFTADTHFVVYMDARSSEPSMELHSRAELAPVFDDLNRYVATTHFNGQTTVTISGAAATAHGYRRLCPRTDPNCGGTSRNRRTSLGAHNDPASPDQPTA